MIDTSLRWAIRALVDVALPDWHPTRALYIGIDCRMNDRGADTVGASGSIHILVQKVANYLTVWIKEDDKILPNLRDVKDFGDNVCHHDSCWIDSIDTAISAIYFDLAKATNSKRPPVELSYRFNLYKVEVVDITTEMVERDLNRRWVIQDITRRQPSR